MILGGSDKNDTLTGSMQNDLFNASSGSDLIIGGGGIDKIAYTDNVSKYVIYFKNGFVYIKKPDGNVDKLSGVEQVQFDGSTFSLSEVPLNIGGVYSAPLDLDIQKDGSTVFLTSITEGAAQRVLSIVSPDVYGVQNYSFSTYGSITSAADQGSNRYIISTGPDTYGGTGGPELFLLRDGMVQSLGAINFGIDFRKYIVSNLRDIGINNNVWTVAFTTFAPGDGRLWEYNIDLASLSVKQNFQVSVPTINDFAYNESDSRTCIVYLSTNIISYIPTWGADYYDTRVNSKIVDKNGITLSDFEIGGAAEVIDSFLTSSQLSDGRVFAAWDGREIGGAWNSFLHGAIVDPTGLGGFSTFEINQNPEKQIVSTSSCGLSGGGVAVVWAAAGEFGYGFEIYGRIYGPDGKPVGDQFQINNQTWGSQDKPIVSATTDNCFICYWNDTNFGGVYQKFDSLGNPMLFNITGTALSDVVFGGDGDQQILGLGGNDTLSGGGGQDILIGGDGNDELIGGGGDDILNGGSGYDCADYTATKKGVNVNLATGVAEGIGGDGAAETGHDRLSGIEEACGGSGNDILTAATTDSMLEGAAGSDTLTGGAGNDTLYGGDGDDIVTAGDGNDLIIGGDGAGDDTYNGGAGIDTIKYTSAKAGIKVDLTLSSDNATSLAGKDVAGIGTDKITGVENIIAGNFSDVLKGDGANNQFTGGAGNDTIDGGVGADTAVYTGAKAQYTIVKNSDGSITVTDLRSTGVTDGIDRIINIEALQFSDQLVQTSNSTSIDAPVIASMTPLTNNPKPTISGTATALSTVTILDGTTTLGTATASATGAWTFMPTAALTTGAHSITATAKDPAGNVSAVSTAITLTIDTTAPDKPVLTTANTTTNNTKPIIAGTAEAGSTVTVYDGTTALGTVKAGTDGAWSFTPSTALTTAAHAIAAKTTDAAGNMSVASAAVTVTVGTTPPGKPILPIPQPAILRQILPLHSSPPPRGLQRRRSRRRSSSPPPARRSLH